MHVKVDTADDGDVAVETVHDGFDAFIENVDWTVVIDFSRFGGLVVELRVEFGVMIGEKGKLFGLSTGAIPGECLVGVKLAIATRGVSFE